MTFLG